MQLPSEIIKSRFEYEPTQDQLSFFRLLDDLLISKSGNRTVLLKGYAGTGKTTVLNALVKVLPALGYRYMLLAPTGRAAKVMSQYTRKSAFTIHKILFKPMVDQDSGYLQFQLQKNYAKNTLFVIDESSMISTFNEFGRKSLLDQIIEYVFEEDSNRLIIIGDDAQLPPVGQVESRSLDASFLKKQYGLTLSATQFLQVVRQEHDSGILYNATKIRNSIISGKTDIGFEIGRFKDIFRLNGDRLEDGLRYCYAKYGVNNTMIICRSNKSALQYNRYIRNVIFYYENELEAGDVLMIAKNNYFHLDENSTATFLANGDMVEVRKILKYEELYGYRFALLELRLLDYPDEPFEARIILDTLYLETASMTAHDYNAFHKMVEDDYVDLADPKEKAKAIKTDPYLNALQVRFAYALTCHKSQGGQWDAVFIDQGYLTDDMINIEYLRWLYTAVTRPTSELFLLNFHQKFFRV